MLAYSNSKNYSVAMSSTGKYYYTMLLTTVPLTLQATLKQIHISGFQDYNTRLTLLHSILQKKVMKVCKVRRVLILDICG